MADERRSERWHVGKEIPIAVILGLLIQTVGLVWFAATQTAKLDNLTVIMTEFRASQYTQADARRDQEIQFGRSINNSRRIDEITRRLEVVENSRKFSGQ